MLVRRALLFILAWSHVWGAGAAKSSLARSDEEFSGGAAGPRLRGGPEVRGPAPLEGGSKHHHARTVTSKAVFPAILAGFLLVFGFFWDDSEGDVSGKIAQRMELWAPPAVAGRTSAKKHSAKDTEGSDVGVLPVLSSDFVRACSSTQLAVGCVPFGDPDGWSTDVLGFMGVPVLSAAARQDADGTRVLEIRRRGGCREEAALVAVRAGQVFHSGKSIGRFTASGGGQQVFHDSHGRPLLVAAQSAADSVLTMSSTCEARQVQATAAWRAASAVLPTEHLEVSAKPGVDAALALACALAALDVGDSGRAAP